MGTKMAYCLFSAATGPAAEGWVLGLPLLAGAAAIYMLLPRPRPYPVLWGAVLGLAALVVAGVLLTPSSVFSPETILFWFFSALAIVAGAILVTQHNPARAALAFAMVVLCTCGLFLLLAAPFLMAATLIVYAGAIIVTFLFVIMLAAHSGLSDADDRSREPLLTTLAGFLLLGALLFVLQYYASRSTENMREIDKLLARAQETAAQDSRADMEEKIGKPGDEEELFNQFNKLLRAWKDLHQRSEQAAIAWSNIDRNAPDAVAKSREQLKELVALGESAQHRLGWLPTAVDAPFSNLSGPSPTAAFENLRRDEQKRPRMPADNAAYLGRALFSDFLLPVELAGLLLLTATVGAIAIAFRRS
jgi:NADH-quinone oxidoreductase subunit J